MREDYVRSRDRRRAAISWSLALLLYAAAFGVVALKSLLSPDYLGAYSGPITIRIGTPEGTDETSQRLPLSPSVVSPVEVPSSPPPAEPTPEPPQAPPKTPAEKAPELPALAAAPPPAKDKKPESQPTPNKVAPTAVAPAIPSPAPGEGSIQPSNAVVGPTSSVGSGNISLKGSEQGNSLQTSYEAGSGKIGRSLYVPIYLFMPLPQTISKSIYDAIPASKDGLLSAELRKSQFRSLYDQSGDFWKLKAQPALNQRPRFWPMLSDAGYPLVSAEYKQGKDLKPVVLEFEVGAQEGENNPRLISVKVLNSSGYEEIDEAVVFGFEQAAFFNDSEHVVRGRFSYNFE